MIRARIRRLFYAEHWKIGTIAVELGCIATPSLWPSRPSASPTLRFGRRSPCSTRTSARSPRPLPRRGRGSCRCPSIPSPCDAIQTLHSGKTPYLRFDGNDYSIPHALVRKPLLLVASELLVRVLDGDDEVASHERSWERGRQIEDRRHLEGFEDDKRRAREHRGRNRVMAACSSAHPFLEKVAQHGGHVGGTTSRLLRLLDDHGPSELDFALSEAHRRGAFAVQSVARILDQRRRARKAAVPLPVVLPDDPRVRDLRVSTRPLGAYDALARSGDKKPLGRPHYP
jgi:hypothetical protein